MLSGGFSAFRCLNPGRYPGIATGQMAYTNGIFTTLAFSRELRTLMQISLPIPACRSNISHTNPFAQRRRLRTRCNTANNSTGRVGDGIIVPGNNFVDHFEANQFLVRPRPSALQNMRCW